MKEKISNFISKNVWLRKTNVSMLVLSAYYIGLTLYSLYYSLQGYIFYPNNRERLLNLFMLAILLLAFMIISPDKETHHITLFSVICASILAVSTCIFSMRIIHIHLRYEAVFTILVCVLAISVSVAASFGSFEAYPVSDFLKTKKGSLIALIPKALNVALIFAVIIFLFSTPFKVQKYVEPQSFSTSYSPNKKYVARTEEDELKDGSKQNYIRVYDAQADKEIFFGKFDYCGPALAEFPIENRNNMNYVWTGDRTFIAQGQTYEFND